MNSASFQVSQFLLKDFSSSEEAVEQTLLALYLDCPDTASSYSNAFAETRHASVIL